jgi:thiamine pyrophosphokinase
MESSGEIFTSNCTILTNALKKTISTEISELYPDLKNKELPFVVIASLMMVIAEQEILIDMKDSMVLGMLKKSLELNRDFPNSYGDGKDDN